MEKSPNGTQNAAVLKALTTLVRNDYSFSDYGLGPSFYNLSLLQAPFTSEIVVSKQMMREVAIGPLFRIFSFGKMVQYLSGKGSSLTQREVIRTKINFSALLSKDTPG